MAVSITRLRRWFAGGAIALLLLIAGVYFYARHLTQNALKQVPEKIGLEIQQTATGFTISKSAEGRTLFKIEASKAVQFKQGGHAELHDVSITIYGRDSRRYDQISGSDFDYDPQSGDVTAKGEIQIDLEANPQGVLHPDQAVPMEIKNPIHLKTSGLVFNQKTGDAYTKERVDFRLAQATGSAVGMTYLAKTNVLVLASQVNVADAGPAGSNLTAEHATISKAPHQILLDHPQIENGSRRCESEKATLFLRPDNTIDSVLAVGEVQVHSPQPPVEARADQLKITMGPQQGTVQSAVFSGNVRAHAEGQQPVDLNSGQATFFFTGKSLLTKIRAQENVRIVQHQSASNASLSAQDITLTAPAVDFLMTRTQHLDRAETSTGAEIAIRPVAGNGPETVAKAGTFHAHFGNAGELLSIHGAPDARIVSKNAGQPDRVSTSQVLEVAFHPGGGIESIVQQGNVAYVDGERKAWSDRGRYTPATQVLLLSGEPRVVESGMTTTANTMRLDRTTGDAFAESDVKSTYSDLKPQPDGALLASASPIHVTARSMTVHGNSAVALYNGDVRLWQDANAVEAPRIDFDRDHRSMVAYGSDSRPVSTVLAQTDAKGVTTPIALTSSNLTYTDNERQAHFEGGVIAKGSDATITSKEMDAFLQARGPESQKASLTSAGKLDRIVANGAVVVTQPTRRADGKQLVYTAADDKFVLTGGPPSIFDAERGKITGVSLTFFRHDDRVLVEGDRSSPAVTQTRVAR